MKRIFIILVILFFWGTPLYCGGSDAGVDELKFEIDFKNETRTMISNARLIGWALTDIGLGIGLVSAVQKVTKRQGNKLEAVTWWIVALIVANFIFLVMPVVFSAFAGTSVTSN